MACKIVANTLSEQPKWKLAGVKLLMMEGNLGINLVEISKNQHTSFIVND